MVRPYILMTVFLCAGHGMCLTSTEAQEPLPTAPPAASSRLDLTQYATAHNFKNFVGLVDASRDAKSLATLLSAAIIKADQQEQAWLLLGDKGILPRNEYGNDPSISGFAVITDLVEIDANDKPKAVLTDIMTHYTALDFFNKETAMAMLSAIVKGRPNGRFRVIGLWVNDVGHGTVQTTQHASSVQWQALMNAGDKAPPLQVLRSTNFSEPHVTALVYEYQVSAINGGQFTFVPQGDPVMKHLKASGLWTALGLQ